MLRHQTIRYAVFIALLRATVVSSYQARSTFANYTSPTTTQGPSPSSSNCCFVVQDTITENAWMKSSVVTTYSVVNLTSITTLVTLYPTATSTNYDTNIYTTNATFTFTYYAEDFNTLFLSFNAASGISTPAQVINALNGSQTTTGGVIVASPTAFWEYNSVKIITAEAVTDKDGRIVCGTTSTFMFGSTDRIFTLESESTYSVPYTTISNVYTSVETLYSTLPTSNFLSPSATSTITITNVVTFSFQTESDLGPYTTSTETIIFTDINSNAEASITPSNNGSSLGVTIPLNTPFVYVPSIRASNGLGGAENNENYGYPPQQLIDYLAGDPFYSSQYPGIESCLPGGPSIAIPSTMTSVSPATEDAGGDLTSSTIITITASVNPVTAVPESSSFGPASSSTPQISLPTSPPESKQPPSASTSPVIPGSPTPSIAATTPIETPPANTVASNNLPTTAQTPGTPDVASQASSQILSVPSNGAIVSAIFSIGGIQKPSTNPAVEGPSKTIINIATTIPINPTSSSEFSGVTTVISGTTNVIVSLPETVGLANPLPGIATLISGSLNVVITGSTLVPVNSDLPALSGSTTVESGTTYVVVSAATTIPVVQSTILGAETISSGAPSSSSGSTAVGTTPVQANSCGRTVPTIAILMSNLSSFGFLIWCLR